ncbi:MAG: NUDIX domain-containing protein [Gammaproteobacteria bacterium]|nr:NUDIX domain-containing protein [Gammaproteobacteria bacterium]
MSTTPAPARPSATVVIARDRAGEFEVLLLRRNERVVFHGGSWVFPGGRVDEADAAEAAGSEIEAARRAAVREAVEETGLAPDPASLLPFAHWTTPEILPKRFATWFFLAPLEHDEPVVIDNSEIVDFRWYSPAAALAAHAAGDIELPAPTFVSLLGFSRFAALAALRDHLREAVVERFVPRVVKLDDGRATLYEEDAGYATLDMAAPGPRHRLVMRGREFEYIRDF